MTGCFMFPTLSKSAIQAVLLAIFMLGMCIAMGEALASESIDKSPLRADERGRVTAIAMGSAGRQRQLNSGNSRELLLVERRPGKASNVRRADVYIYDYATNQLEHQVINVDDGEIVHADFLQDVQLPLTTGEINRSSAIVFNDVDAKARLDTEFRRVTGKPLDSAEQIHFKAFSFVADQGRQRDLAMALHDCGRTRCAQILMYTSDRVVLDVSPVVDLSSGQVLTVMSNGVGMDGERR